MFAGGISVTVDENNAGGASIVCSSGFGRTGGYIGLTAALGKATGTTQSIDPDGSLSAIN